MRRQFGGATTNGRRQISLRYGTNPHQSNDAELYSLQEDMPIQGRFISLILMPFFISDI